MNLHRTLPLLLALTASAVGLAADKKHKPQHEPEVARRVEEKKNSENERLKHDANRELDERGVNAHVTKVAEKENGERHVHAELHDSHKDMSAKERRETEAGTAEQMKYLGHGKDVKVHLTHPDDKT